MESSPSAMLKLLLPKTPMILKTALWHTLSLSETSSKWDLKTELTVKILRDMLGPNSKPTSISQQQHMTTKDPGIKGKIWVSKVNFPTLHEQDADSVRQAVFNAIKELGDGTETFWQPENVSVYGEWTGYRAAAGDKDPDPAGLSEKEKYEALMKETSNKTTLLYFHGGAMFLLDPSTYRHVTSKLARVTGGRVFSARYRLAPQNPFPAALLDALTAYLGLLYPPEGSPHAAVPANEIVFGGDSAGGMLSTSLLQLLLQFRRTNTKIRFHGQSVDVPLPAGVALVSPWLDVTRSLPSIESLAHYDYLPPPSQLKDKSYPQCSAWPSDPPRAELYCETSALLHPLVSPLAATDWTNSPPVFFSLGEEMLRDEDAVLAKRIHEQGVTVVWRLFEAMPHVFAYMLEGFKGSDIHFDEYARFCNGVVGTGQVESDGVVIKAKTYERENVELGSLSQFTEEDVERHMSEARERIRKKERGALTEVRPML